LKKIIIIAGPNGAGKTTFARDFLPAEWMLVTALRLKPRCQAWST
jgi:predicted kinase